MGVARRVRVLTASGVVHEGIYEPLTRMIHCDRDIKFPASHVIEVLEGDPLD